MPSKTALIAGATGLVGNALLNLLLQKDYYQKIIVLTRKELRIKDNRLEVILLKDFDQLESVSEKIQANDYYVALGTTMKKAGSKEAFLKVDVEYPLKIALIAMNQPDFRQFLVVTSYGANANSPLFYNRAKGRLEDGLIKLNLKSLKIFQPSLLIGYRDEFRFWEEVAKGVSTLLSFFVIGSKRRLWTIRGEEVAKAMYRVARKHNPGLKRYKPGKIIKIANT